MLRTTLRRPGAPDSVTDPRPMNKPFPRFARFALLSTVALAAPAAVLFACATDNGDSVHGPQFGPVPARPDGSLEDGPSQQQDEGGSMTSDAEAGADAPGTDGATRSCRMAK